MDKTTVKRIAAQTGLDLYPGWVSDGRGLDNLIAFAKAVESHERKACCEAIDAIDDGEAPEYRACQEAIMARSNGTELTGAQNARPG